jgi:Protein of unknown function (DUF2947)
MEGVISIKQSEFCKEFESVDLKNTFILSTQKAEDIWRMFIDKDFKPFHSLDKTHWLLSNSSKLIGSWLELYNNEDYQTVAKSLDLALEWNEDDILFFFKSRRFVIMTTYQDFKIGWINFLMCEDDSPVLVNKNINKSVLVFTPIGVIKKVATDG